ncbi:YfcL family protein [Citrobacter braakii]
MIAEFESRILALIDDMVEHASDDELFASGYLRGHLTLAVAELDAGVDHSAEALYANVTSSLEKAISAACQSKRDILTTKNGSRLIRIIMPNFVIHQTSQQMH